MNILIDNPPEIVIIDSLEYEINSNFRESILFELLMQDDDLSKEEQIAQALDLYYPVLPNNIEEALKKIIWFYNCGKDSSGNEGKSSGSSGKVKHIYSFEFDCEYIFSAFLSQYSIDLADIEYLHWWKFKALFMSLNKDNKIMEIMSYRSMDLSDIKDKEQRKHYKQMKDMYAIPSAKSKAEEGRINSIEDALINGEFDKLESLLSR
ncbi:MAG: bacteriophage Gp15 family protein [Paraclostridium sp.]